MSDQDPKFPLGALLPPDLAWQEDKTAAVIAFVNEAGNALRERNDLSADEIDGLRATIDLMKNGQASLTDWDTVDAWLERRRNHHP